MRARRLTLLIPLLALTACGSTSSAPPAPPIASAGPDQTVAASASVTLDASGSSAAAGLALSYQWAQTSGPAVGLAGATTARPTFAAPSVPSLSPAAVLVFSLVVSTPSGATSTSAVTITVNPSPPTNYAPVASAGANQVVDAGALVTLDGSASGDLDGQSITYAWTQTSGPAVTLAGAAGARPTFTAPALASGAPAMLLAFSLVVRDADASSPPSSVAVTVNPAAPGNPPPTASAGADQAVASGATVALDGGGSFDPDLQAIAYAWTQASGPSVTLSDATSVTPTFTAPVVPSGAAPAALVFTLVVRDADASSTPSAVTVTVNPAVPANPPPLASAGPNQAVASGGAVTLDGSGSADPDGQPLTYAWTQTAGPTVVLSGATTAHPTFTAPAVASGAPAAVLAFALVVRDPDAASSASTVTVTVNPAGNLCQAGGPPPPPPGTPAPAAPGATPPPSGASGSHRFQMGTYLPSGLYLVDPVPGEPTVEGFVVVSFGSTVGPAPADAVVTMNGVPLKRVTTPGASGLFWQLDPAGPQPKLGSGGALVLVASATDPTTMKPIQRTLVLPCPSDISLTLSPSAGASLVPSTPAAPAAIHLASPADLVQNPLVLLMNGSPPTATLWGYQPCSRALVGYGSPHPIPPGPLAFDVPVCQGAAGACEATTAAGYLLDLRWPGPFIPDGESGGFCGLAKRVAFTR